MIELNENYIMLFVTCKKIGKPKKSYTLKGTLVLSVICIKCKNEDEKVFKEELIDWDWDFKDS